MNILHTDLYRHYGRALPSMRAQGNRESVIGTREAYTIQLFTTLDDDPPVVYHIHDKIDASDGNLFVTFQANQASYHLQQGDYYLVDNCKFHVQGWYAEATKVKFKNKEKKIFLILVFLCLGFV